MAWDFSNDEAFDRELVWMRDFVDREILPLETLAEHWHGRDGQLLYRRITEPLRAEVKTRGLWAAHLPPELGGSGFGQVALGLMHEILGRSRLAPPIFGNQAPDSGNAELLALGGSDEQKRRWLEPLLDGRIYSCFSMTEPGAGADPTMMTTRAVLADNEWVIDGEKWFISNASVSDFHIVMCRTGDDGTAPHRRFSMFLVPSDTPGVDVVRDIATMDEPNVVFGEFGSHSEVRYESVRVPADAIIGEVGEGFSLAQKRLGPGRIHHAMRWLGQSGRAFDMLCERAVSRTIHGSVLADKQMVQEWVAESHAEIQAARLLTLQAAWRMDRLHAQGRPYSDARVDIGLIKFWGGRVLYNVIDRAIQIHGALGYSSDLPLEGMYRAARSSRLYDGPDEVHKVTVAKQLLRHYQPREVPSEHVPTRRDVAQRRFVNLLELSTANS